MWAGPLVQEDPLKKGVQPNLATPLFLPGKRHRQRSLEGYSPGDCKESNMTENTHTHTHTQYRQ